MNDSERLTIAIVTGANRGIGLEVVHQLAQQGMTVVMGTRDLEKGQAAAEELSKQGFKVLPYPLDATAFCLAWILATMWQCELA